MKGSKLDHLAHAFNWCMRDAPRNNQASKLLSGNVFREKFQRLDSAHDNETFGKRIWPRHHGKRGRQRQERDSVLMKLGYRNQSITSVS